MKKKEMIMIILKTFFLISVMMVYVLGAKPMKCEAYTAKSINKEIKKVTKQLKSLEKKDKARRKGLISIAGSVVNNNPFIVKSIFNNYYWVNNPQGLETMLGATSGAAKDTGKTKVFFKNGVSYTCSVVTAKKLNAKMTSKIVSLKRKLDKLKNTKRNRLYINSLSINLVRREKYNITRGACWLYKDAYSQKLSFFSSKKSVASVNKATGLVTAKKAGSTIITIKAKTSGKKTKVKINVIPPYIKFPETNHKFLSNGCEKTGYIDVDYCSISRNISIAIGDTSIISSAENTIDGIKCTYTGKIGQTTITAKIKEGVSATCIVNVNEYHEEDSDETTGPVMTSGPSEHSHETEIKWDEDYHWKQCHICNEIQEKEMHNWIFDEEESLEATVDNAGFNIYYCEECFKEKTVEVPKLQHQCYDYLELVQGKEATCTEEGNIKYYKCTWCNKLYKDGYPLQEIKDLSEVVLEKKSHVFSDKWSSNEIYHWKACTTCGAINILTNQIHIWNAGEVLTEPTETEKGKAKYICTVCGKTQERDVDALGHQCANHLTKVEEKTATCEEEGNILYYSCECGKWYSDDKAHSEITNHNDVLKDKLSHSYGDEWNKDEDYHWKSCVECGSIDILNKQEHTWDDGEVLVEPTEKEKGTAKYTCTICGKTKEETVDALGHQCANHLTKVEEKVATCEEEGNILYYTCECGKWYSDDKANSEITNHNDVLKDKLSHSYGDEWNKDEDYHWKTCVECGAIDILNKQEHIWNTGEVLTEPTEIEKGKAKYTCTVCGKTQERDIDALGHQCANHLTQIEEKAATCEEEGNILYYTCECGKWYTDDKADKEIIDKDTVKVLKLGHNWVYDRVTKEPTETEKGEKQYKCSNCGETKTEEIAALGHQCARHLTKVEEVTAQCEKDGNTTYYICECGKWYTDDKADKEIIDKDTVKVLKLGHNWVYDRVTKEPTETEKGEKQYKCSNCGETKTEEIAGVLNTMSEKLVYSWDELIDNKIIKVTDNSIERMELPSSVNQVSLSIPNSVTSIGNYAFEGCSGLTNVTIPDSVKSIGYGAFEGCSGLTSVTIPNSVTSIASSVFYGCSGLTSVTIPNSVTSISSSVFYGCSGLTNVTIPNSVTSIGDYAFLRCSGLTNVTIPDSVKSIGYQAFYGCSGLTSVTISNSITSIGDYAFYECSGLTNVTIPNSVTSIGGRAFARCSGLISVTIPDSVKSIGYYAFSGCSSLPSIDIPSGVTSIGAGAFQSCTNLSSIEIPSGVTSIKSYAFSGCSSLPSIDIPSGVTSIGESAFERCTSLPSIDIPSGVTSIGHDAFSGCTSLSSIEIPSGVTSIGDRTFYECSSLTSIELPSGVTSIGESAFEKCTNLSSIELPSGVTSIGNSAFKKCTSLSSIELPSGVTSIGHDAFSGCSNLTSIKIPSGVTSIESNAFSGCSSLSSIELPSELSSIGYYAFYACTNLTSIEIPTGVRSIGDSAFSGCSNLTSIKIPSGVTSIESYAFCGCSRLTSIELPSGVTSIGKRTFYACTNLTSIEIPSSVRSIGDDAFYNVPHIYYHGLAKGAPWGALAIN